ncbi:MAG: hypothetical protein WA705_14840 [Candidatus Ozemobacteraceae bacterium]
MEAYKVSGRTEDTTVMAMIGFGLLGAIGTAILTGLLNKWIDLLIVVALGMGFFVGLAVKSGARRGHCRNGTVIALIAIMMGILAYSGKLFMNYRNERQTSIASIQSEIDENKTIDAKIRGTLSAERIYDGIIQKKTGSTGFIAWLKILLENGISISHHGGKGLNLGFIGSIILMLIEALCVAGIAWSVAIQQLDEPYCEHCLAWSEEAWEKTLSPEALELANARLMETQNPESLPYDFLSDSSPGDTSMAHGKLTLVHCPQCRDSWLSGSLITINEKKETATTKVFQNLHIPNAVLDSLMKKAPENPEA